MKYYLKKAFFVLVYVVLTSFISAAILLIEGQVALKIILLIANLAMFIYITFGIAYQDGQKALKVRIANDKEREYIVNTGEDRKIKVSEEYKWYKGLVIGFLTCVPLMVILIIHSILISNNPLDTRASNISNFLYLFVLAFANLDPNGVHKTVIYASPYWALLAIPLIMIILGVGFYLGARKIELQQQRVKDIHKSIYGE